MLASILTGLSGTDIQKLEGGSELYDHSLDPSAEVLMRTLPGPAWCLDQPAEVLLDDLASHDAKSDSTEAMAATPIA